MSVSANVRSVQALIDLRNGLNRFSNDAQGSLQTAEQEIRRVEEWLRQRLAHWQTEVQRCQEALRAAESALVRCEASGYRDEKGYYHAPDCSAYVAAVAQANTRLQQAQAELNNVKNWMRHVNQAASTYRVQSQRMSRILQNEMPKAISLLGEKISELQAYLTSTMGAGTTLATPTSNANAGLTSSNVDASSKPGITWAEKQAILKKIDQGTPLSMEEFQKLGWPISDLQTMTLVEDNRWIEDLLNSQRFFEAMRDSREAQDLRDAILATLKIINYWRSRS